MTIFGILIDTTRCVGCEKCISACKKENRLGQDKYHRWSSEIDELSSTRYSTIRQRAGNHFVRVQCRHCTSPACVSACLVGAMQKTPEGPVIYDGDRCMGCRYCMIACPYGIPRYDWDKAVPYVRKCSMCYFRIKENKKPACVDACETGALIFGERSQLLKEAHLRISQTNTPYINKIVGENEIGGTSVLYISDISLDFLSFNKQLNNKPLPELTWAALSKVPPLILGVGGLMTGLYWIVGRRMKISEKKNQVEGKMNNHLEANGKDEADSQIKK